jgi:ribosomal protein S18 acetylase RimI-like enzyme
LLKLEKKHIEPVSCMLARAFIDAPFNAYAFPDAQGGARRIPYAYQSLLRYYSSYGRCYVTSPRLEGAAIWIHSDNLRMSLWGMITSGAVWSGLRLGLQASRRMQAVNRYVEKKHHELAPGQHWYLFIIGVDPQHQGRGYASQLLRGMLAQIDAEGLPCYLESETRRSVPIYRHFDFEVVEEINVPGTVLSLTAMLRQPRT